MEKDRGLSCWDMSPSDQVICPLHSHAGRLQCVTVKGMNSEASLPGFEFQLRH